MSSSTSVRPQTTATQRCLFIDYFKTWMDSLVAIIRVVKWRCGKKRVPRLWLQTRWHLPHINASFSEALLYRDVSFTPSFFISKCFAFWWCRGFVTLFLSCCWFFLSVHIPEHPVCLPSCVWWEQMQVPVVLLWLLTPPLLFLCNVLPFFRKEGRLLLFKEGYSDFFVIPVTAHRLLDSAQKKRERERGKESEMEGEAGGQRKANGVEVTCSIFLWTEQFPWHQSIKGQLWLCYRSCCWNPATPPVLWRCQQSSKSSFTSEWLHITFLGDRVIIKWRASFF